MALRDTLNLKPDIVPEPMMLTPLQQALLRQEAKEIVTYLKQSPRLKAFLNELRPPERGSVMKANIPLSASKLPFMMIQCLAERRHQIGYGRAFQMIAGAVDDESRCGFGNRINHHKTILFQRATGFD
jgi:hypothetical protein